MIEVLESIASAGFFPGVLGTGLMIGLWSGSNRVSERLSISPALGLLVWTAPMVVMAGYGIYRPWQFGLTGWLVTALLIPSLGPRIRRLAIGFDPVWIVVLVVAVLYGLWSFLYSGETFLGGRDQGGYANHALHLARTGRLLIEFPFEGFSERRFFPIYFLQNLSNLGFLRGEAMEAQFPPIYAIWMAQAVGVFGRMGVLGFNPIMAALSVPLFFGLARRLLDRPASLVALCVFLLTPIQIWMPRITLSEIAAQHFVFAALLLVVGGWLDRRIRMVLLGGLLLGGVYWIRIDGLVAAPMIVFGLAAIGALGTRDPESTAQDATFSVWYGATALATMGLVTVSHSLTSSHYFLANGTRLGQIGLLTVVLIPGFFLCRNSRIKEWVTRFFGLRMVGLILIGLLVALIAWAYWIRPFAEPFRLFPLDPGRGRTYQEDSLVNIVAYLTKPAAILALFGLIAALWILLRGRMERAWYVPFAIWGGYSVLLITDPHISPDHLWAMRRFVPVIMPGFALFAGFGFATLTRTLSADRGKGFAAFITCFILAAVMLPGSSTFAFFKENRGTNAFLLNLDARIPSGSLVFSDTGTLFFDPLYPGLGHRVVRVDLGDAEMPSLIDAIIREHVPEGESVYYLTQARRDHMIEALKTDRLRIDYDVIDPTMTPPPTGLVRRVHNLNLYESKRAPHDPSLGFGSVTIGSSPVAGIEESGFHGVESNEHGPFRWTTDRWRLKIPLREGYRPRSLVLNIGDLPPQGCDLLVRVNETDIHRARYGSAPGRIEIDLPTGFDHSVLDLQGENDVFVPAEVEGRGADQRALGLMLYGVTISDQPASKGTFELGIAPAAGVEEGGFHDPEVNEAGSFRWTNGGAWLELPLPAGYVMRSIDVTILDLPPDGTDLEILLNGDPVHKAWYSSPPGTIAIDIMDFPPTLEGDVVRLDVRSATFRPADREMGSDERTLGVRLHGIVLTDRPRKIRSEKAE